MQIAVVLVHYHTPHLLMAAIEALQEDATTADLHLEGIVVDNGSRPQDVSLLKSLPFPVVDAASNLGYAGGVNLGLKSTESELAVVMNPDVMVLPGCLAGLVAALQQGASVVGPRFYWDASRHFQLPPTEQIGHGAELLRVLAERGGRWCRWARRRWRRHSRRFFLADRDLGSYDLSGALLGLRRDAWNAVGPWDEDYPLYFEETDWLHRMRRAGKPCRFVPAAEAVHLYAQSTVKEGRAQRWFEVSQRRFRHRFYGPRWTRGLEALATRLGTYDLGSHEMASDDLERNLDTEAAWLEVAASPKGFPAAVRRLDGGPRPSTWDEALPPDIRSRMAPGTYYLRTVDTDGREREAGILKIERDED